MTTTSKASNEEISYETARTRLIEIVGQLEQGAGTDGLSLDESLKLWGEANELGIFCQKYLDDALKLVSSTEK